MKNNLTFLLIATLLISRVIQAQTNPGTSNLTHQWTFDDGTANDIVTTNPVNGSLQGGATIENRALDLTGNGQYLSFPGSALAINNYSVITQEIWFTSVEGANTDYTMLTYFGNTNSSDGMGYNYLSTSAARGDDVSRTAISNGTYDSETGVNGTEYDDGKLHQMVSVVNTDSILLYIDGKLASKTANSISLSTIGSSLACLGKSGYTNDPTWIGTISRFSIYNKSLAADEVMYLYQQGAETTPFISASVKSLSFDSLYTKETIYVTGSKLDNDIIITTPDGITASPVILDSAASNASVTINYDGSTLTDGNIILTSGSTVLNIPLKSYSNSCFTQLYSGVPNLVKDPYISDLASFAGWGNRSINSDHEYVYCGATSGKVSGSNGGSLDVSLTGNLVPNTVYRVKAKVMTIGGIFQLGVSGWSTGQGDYTKTINTSGTWKDIDFSLKTGNTLGSTQGLFFNNYNLSGITGYIDNWEMYAIPKVYTSSSSLDFITTGTKIVTVRGVNLADDITITSPDGFTLSPSVLSSDANGSIISVTFNSSVSKNGYIYFKSGNVTDSLQVKGTVDPVIIPSVSYVSMDEISDSAALTISGYNLINDITLSAPAGITLSTSSLPATISDSVVSVSFDGNGNSSGYLTFISGTAKDSIRIFAERNDDCFTPAYSYKENLIVDPTCNYYLKDGSGNISINTDPEFVYCGSRSGKVINNGSLKRGLAGILKPNTTYRMRAKIYKVSKTGTTGNVTFTLAFDSATYPQPYRLIKAAMDSACYYFNNYTPFVANIRVVFNTGIPTAQANYHGEIGFGANTRYMWVGTAMHEMCHYFGSGTTSVWQAKMVNGIWSGEVATALMKSVNGGPIHGDTQHFWPYGINQKEEVTDLGSIAAQQDALTITAKLAKAMLVDDCGLPTNNPSVGIGVHGFDATKKDIYQEETAVNSWQDVDFSFKTGSLLKSTQDVYFNSGTGYIDNWELYEISADVTLSDIKVNGISIEGFDAETLTYDVELTAGTDNLPVVTASATDAGATVEITDITELPDSAIIIVTAEDGETQQTYTVNFTIATSVSVIENGAIKVYPTVSSSNFKIETNSKSNTVTVYNMTGNIVKFLKSGNFNSTITVPEAGVYILKVENNGMTKFFRVIKTNK